MTPRPSGYANKRGRISAEIDVATQTLENIYNKLTHYIRKLQSYVNVLDPLASAAARDSIAVRQDRSVFFYPNMAAAQAGVDAYENKLKLPKIAIVGLGGTGSYILDALAKTPVQEIHLYDNDNIEPASVPHARGANL
ncbi:MAG TPA: ThiF family adenylyltransferase [Terriglobales bacterium]|nr:ThiF family adenylyltransferase [Terriglobales bacterium]